MSCDRCQAERMRADAIENDLHLEQKENLRLRRVSQALEMRNGNDAIEADKRDPDIHKALSHWLEATGRSKRTNIKPGSDRWTLVAKVLKKHKLDLVLQVIDGAARAPYMNFGERLATPVEGRPQGGRKDELSFIFKSDERMEACVRVLEDEALMFQVERFRTCGVKEERAYEIMHLRNVVAGLEAWAAWVWGMASREDRDRLLGELQALHRLERFQEAQVEVAERRLRLVKDEEAA